MTKHHRGDDPHPPVAGDLPIAADQNADTVPIDTGHTDPGAAGASPPAESPENDSKRGFSPKAKIITGTVVAVILVIAFLILREKVPLWWSDLVVSWVGGDIAIGIALGLLFGIIGTAGLLVFAVQAVNAWMQHGRVLPWIYTALACLVMIPNLMTLAIAHSSASGAIAAQLALDGDGVGFRGASATGAALGVVAGIAANYFILRREREKLAKRHARHSDSPKQESAG